MWEEFCHQMQWGDSIFADAYEATIRMMVERTVNAMTPSEAMLLWLSSDEYFEYDPEREGNDGLFPCPGEMAEAIVAEIYQGVCDRAVNDEVPEAPWEAEEGEEGDEESGTRKRPNGP